MQNHKNATLVNVISTVCLQVITLLSGFLIPKLILSAFGSEINGLVSSITQFLNYISLLEGGVGSVILANLYKPLATGDMDKVSSIVAAANGFFRKLAMFFLGYQLILAVVYPFFVETELSWGYIASLTLILGIGTFVQYYFALTWRLLLQADKRMFIVSLVQGTAVVLSTVATAVIIVLLPSIHLVKFVAGIVYFVQPMIFNRVVAKNYTINKKASADTKVLAQRWDGFGINIAAMVHTGTATVILTLMTDLESVSVFSVYFLVVSGLKSLITSISSGIVPTLGNLYAKQEKTRFDQLFNAYDLIMFFVAFFCFTVGGITVSSFAMVYTQDITDANYYQPLLGALLMLAECMFCIREPYINMAYTAGHFRQVSKYAYTEAVMNIVLAVVFTYLWGLVGVAVAMVVSISYRTFVQVWYIKKTIIRRPMWMFLKKFVGFGAAAAIASFLCLKVFAWPKLTVSGWIVYAAKNALVVGGCLLIAALVTGGETWRAIWEILRSRRKEKTE
jgi:O-antigen/teichoic acid export membrane protein